MAFERTLAETCALFRWRVHPYVIMRNHYHLALTTPEPNLAEGMHWLQGTYARFNRLRSENGHLFQGRYQALLVEDAAALAPSFRLQTPASRHARAPDSPKAVGFYGTIRLAISSRHEPLAYSLHLIAVPGPKPLHQENPYA